MKKIIISMVLIFGLNVYAENTQQQCQKIKTDDVAQSGCCSWHNGVCGCSGGRAECCDGTLSPTCGCFKDDGKDQVIQTKPELIPQA